MYVLREKVAGKDNKPCNED